MYRITVNALVIGSSGYVDVAETFASEFSL